MLGVEKIEVVPGGADLGIEMQKVADEVVAEGGKPYIISGGASYPLGATGYVACAQEILEQMFEKGINIDYVVVASGSGGTHSGLVTGFYGTNSYIPVIGVSVRRKKAKQEELIYDLVKRTAAYVGVKGKIPRDAIKVVDDYVGPGYSLPTPEMVEAVKILAQTESILLDPVYTGKAMAGLIGLIRTGAKNET